MPFVSRHTKKNAHHTSTHTHTHKETYTSHKHTLAPFFDSEYGSSHSRWCSLNPAGPLPLPEGFPSVHYNKKQTHIHTWTHTQNLTLFLFQHPRPYICSCTGGGGRMGFFLPSPCHMKGKTAVALVTRHTGTSCLQPLVLTDAAGLQEGRERERRQTDRQIDMNSWHLF